MAICLIDSIICSIPLLLVTRVFLLKTAPIPPEKYSNQLQQSKQFIIANKTFVIINLDHWSDGGCPITGYSIKYRTRRLAHFHRNQNENSNGGGWVTLSTHLMPEKDKLIIRDLAPGTWHDLIIMAQNDAGKRDAEYSFATLTETGATVEPLHAFESRMAATINGGFGSGSGISVIGAFFDDPMIFIPAICTIIVLIVVISTSVFLYVMRLRQEALQMAAAGDETYCSHRSSTRLDEMSLNSYTNSNGSCKKVTGTATLINSTLHNGKGLHLNYEKNNVPEAEPLYEQTNFAAIQTAAHQAGIGKTLITTLHKSPRHQHSIVKSQQQSTASQQSQMIDTNLLDTIELSGSTSNHIHHDQSATENYSFEPIFDHRDHPLMGQYFKTLQHRNNGTSFQNASISSSNTTTCHSAHLYQMPEQVKQQIQEQQQQQQTNMLTLAKSTRELNNPEMLMIATTGSNEDCSKTNGNMAMGPGTGSGSGQCHLVAPPIKQPAQCNLYMTTFGIVRPQNNHQQ